MKKKILVVIIAVGLSIITTLSVYAEVDTLVDISREMITQVHTLVGDDYYINHFFLGPREATVFFRNIYESDCTEIRKIYSLKLTKENLNMLYPDYADMSEPGKAKLANSSLTFGHSWNSIKKGSTVEAECIVVSWTSYFDKPVYFENCTWMIDCGGVLYEVIFFEAGEEIVRAEAIPVCIGDDETIDDVIAFSREIYPQVIVAEIEF